MTFYYMEYKNNEYLDLFRSDLYDIIEEYRKSWNFLDNHCRFQLRKELVLKKETINLFDCDYRVVDFFRVPPNHTAGIHIDESMYAFNYIIKGSGTMEWFNKDDLIPYKKSEYGTDRYKLKENCYPAASTDSNLLFVNTQIPHRIVNKGDMERICVSIRFNDLPKEFSKTMN